MGQVGCLPGRTIAFRRDVLEDDHAGLPHPTFLGVVLEVSDDRTLTNLTLKRGYRTVYQSTSLVYTDCPTGLKKMAKQQYRWARGSQYNTLRMFPWMLGQRPGPGVLLRHRHPRIPFSGSALPSDGEPVGDRLPRRSVRGILNGHRPFELPVMLVPHPGFVLGLHVPSPAATPRAVSGRHLLDARVRDLLDPVPAPDPSVWISPYGQAGWVGYPGQRVRRRGHRRDRLAERSIAPSVSLVGGRVGPSAAVATRTVTAPAGTVTSALRRRNPYEIVPITLFLIAIVGGVLYDTWPR